MGVRIQVQTGAGLTAQLDRVAALGRDPSGVLRVGARGALNFLKRYHSDFIPKWRGDRYLSGAPTRWGEGVARAWQDPVVNGPLATVTNLHPHLAHKVVGGTISAKRGPYLTIPLIKEARGRMVSDFRQAYPQWKLFKSPSGRALVMKDPTDKKKLIAVYALKTSVTQGPWPGAMPAQEKLREAFVTAAQAHVGRVLGTGAAGGGAA